MPSKKKNPTAPVEGIICCAGGRHYRRINRMGNYRRKHKYKYKTGAYML